jgi:Domain of unknown function (DUF4342)
MGDRKWVEEIEVAGRDLVDRVQNLLREGNVRRVILEDASGTRLIELPLTAGVAVGGVAVLAVPVVAALGALAALVTNCKLLIVRADGSAEQDAEEPTEPPATTV